MMKVSCLAILLHATFYNLSSCLNVHGDRRLEIFPKQDDKGAWSNYEDENFFNKWMKNVANFSFFESKSARDGAGDGTSTSGGSIGTNSNLSKSTGNLSTDSGGSSSNNGTNDALFGGYNNSGKDSNLYGDWNFMNTGNNANKGSSGPKSTSSELSTGSDENKKTDAGLEKSSESVSSSSSSKSTGSTGSKTAFRDELFEFVSQHPMEKRIKEINILRNEYAKLKAESDEMLDKEQKEIAENRKEEKEKVDKENEHLIEEKEFDEDEAEFVKKKFTDTEIKGGFSEFMSNLNPFKKELKPLKREISTIKYTPDITLDAENIMRSFGITHKYEPYTKVQLFTCPNNNFLFDTLDSLRNEISYTKDHEITGKIFDHNKECLKNFGLLDFELPDNKTKFGTVIGSLGEYRVRLYEIESDLLKYHPDFDYITLADDYKLQKMEISYLENLNFCLLNPKTLEDFLKKEEIMNLIGTDPKIYYAQFTKFMTESITCHIESLIYDDLDSSQDTKLVLKNVKSKLFVLQNGLSYKSRRLVNKIFNEIQKNPDVVMEKLSWIYDNIYTIKRDYTFFAFKGVCDKYVTHHNIFNSIYSMMTYMLEYFIYFSSCFKNVTIYNAIVSGIHEQMKNLMKLMPRKSVLTDVHFQALLQKNNKKITRKDYVETDYDPTVKAFALTEIEREPMVSVINAFFEAKKKELSHKIAQMKLDLLSLTNDELKIPNDNSPNSKLAAKLIRIYKGEIKKFFKEMKADYIYILKARYKSHYKRNYLLFKRLE
ncbi:rhoptry-associated protein 1, putative [Plasmodium ovale]|uniref:Rhoptry-associated protein 1 n=2 Tax=Plasmodium ovale TaxID=36330 RepID=A0A1A8W7L3_PLAOA|nr:rhoptry-associated protein 1 [Plasmodium ovale curtisi]SCP06307.1 rhoptry-associated protein 1, putative [Plasmodium ovale]